MWHAKESSLFNTHECWVYLIIWSPSPVMVTFLLEWKSIEWDEKHVSKSKDVFDNVKNASLENISFTFNHILLLWSGDCHFTETFYIPRESSVYTEDEIGKTSQNLLTTFTNSLHRTFSLVNMIWIPSESLLEEISSSPWLSWNAT